MLLAAIGCGRLPGIIDISERQSFVVFGTMDGKSLAYFENKLGLPVYFYEIG